MKKTKVIIPALGILLLSTAASVTGTVAWFSMNTHVTATGMQVQAKAEDGIVITNEAASPVWAASATASNTGADANLVPTSTADLVNWYHNSSDAENDPKVNQAAATYAKVSADTKWANANGVYFIDSDEDGTYDAAEKAYYLLNNFYIKSSAGAINPATLMINSVTATGVDASAALDASLRVGILLGGNVYIYAPVSQATLSYKVAGTTDLTAVSSVGVNVNTVASGVTQIPGNTVGTGDAINAQVFLYFEGEDLQCKSSNIKATMDSLLVTVQFGTQEVSNG